jgi:uncharacterized protein with GYD domain
MNAVLEWKWKEAAMVHFMVLCRYSSEGIQKNVKASARKVSRQKFEQGTSGILVKSVTA